MIHGENPGSKRSRKAGRKENGKRAMRFSAYRRLRRLLRPATSSISSIPEIAAGSSPKNRFQSPADTGDLTTFRKILWSIDPSVTGLSHVPSTGRWTYRYFIGQSVNSSSVSPGQCITPRDVFR